MKVLYDHQAFSMQTYGGVSRYFSELMHSFSREDGVDWRLALKASNNHYLRNSSREGKKAPRRDGTDRNERTTLKMFSSVTEALRGNIVFRSVLYRLNVLESIHLLQRQDFDLFHPTYFDPYFLPYLGKKPFVLTVYDMIHEVLPEMFLPGDKTASWKKELVRKAAKIMAISRCTKDDLVRYYGIPEEKIVVTYLASSISLEGNRVPYRLGLPNRYILFVGNRDKPFPFKERYKNFAFFVRSVQTLFREKGDLSLICAGGESFNHQERRLFEDSGIAGKVFHYPANERVLANLYQNAALLVLPSLYEGFGLAVLEAFSCGCPVAVSRTSALPEVAGNAAVYFDPLNEDSIREAVRKLLEDRALQEDLRSEGFKQARKFSWRKTAEETKAVYGSVLG
jgi:glycosyltransferase involved in cell wall biosynthesis